MFMLEGNIGSGKSTFLSLIANALKIKVMYEPTDQWQQVGSGGNLLDLFYRDMPRWSYTFQSYAFITRLKDLSTLKKDSVFLAERSIFCDRFCFAKNCFEHGMMSEIEWQLYQEWFEWIAEKCMPYARGFIYLQVPPEVCYERLRKRSRSEEVGVSLDYLKSLHKKHEDWLIQKAETLPMLSDVPVLVIDGSLEFENNKARQLELIKRVNDFMQAQSGLIKAETKEKFDNKQVGMFS